MASLEEIRDARIEKINKLQDAGMHPYADVVSRDLWINEAIETFVDIETSGVEKKIVGRVMALRGQGAIIFSNITDGTGSFQALLKKGELPDELFTLFVDTVDIGDFVEYSGTFFTTKTGEKTILIKGWTMLSKSLAPLPEKWHGLQDVEERYRKRYLEMLGDRTVYERFILRSQIIREIRSFFDARGFLEIETPILKNKAGGAMARPFVTHHNDLDIDMKLRISLEIEHKMLMVAGFPAVYEIGKNFRNEGSDPTHIQEFTMMEWYCAYKTLEDNIAWTEELLKHLATNIVKKTKFAVYDKEGESQEVYFDGAWPRRTFSDLLTEYAGIDMNTISDSDLQKEAQKYGMDKKESQKMSRANLLDFVYKHTARPKLVNPTFVIDYPGDLKPLAQQNSDGTARVAQLIIGGAEITNQYAELVDPMKQRALLERQASARDAGDEEAMEVDEEFLTAMEHGMPPMTGFGMGIDRIIAIFTEQKNLRETIFFPIMKPRE